MSEIKKFPCIKYDKYGKRTLMTRSGGYVMCRRPHCIPQIKSEKEWLEMLDKEILK